MRLPGRTSAMPFSLSVAVRNSMSRVRYHGLGRGEQRVEIAGIEVRGARQLTEVGADGGGAAIVRVVQAFGIHEHGNAQLAGRGNQRLADFRSDRALGIVREHERVKAGQQRQRRFR